MNNRVGAGVYTYEVRSDWFRVPDGWLMGDVAGIAVDGDDSVYVFHRGPHPVIVFDRHGAFVRSWGDGLFVRPHALSIGPDGTVYCTDAGDHTVRACTPEGRVLMTIGTPGRPAAKWSGDPFNMCTDTAIAANGDLLVSDGYGNARVHRYSPSGEYRSSWGEPGIDPGQFNVPHNITVDPEGRVLVADRESHRVQVFADDGTFLEEWAHVHRPSGLFTTSGPDSVSYVTEIGGYLSSNRNWPNVGPRITVLDRDGRRVGRIEDPPDTDAPMISPHGIGVDSRGNVFVGDVAHTAWPSAHPGVPEPDDLRTLHAFIATSPRATAGR